MTDRRPEARHGSALARIETMVALGIVALLALVVTVVAWTTPARATEERTAPYTQSARISYDADTAAGSTYGESGLQTGETVLLEEVGELRVQIAYSLEAAGLAEVRGTTKVEAVVAVSGGLRRTFPVADQPFDGPRTDLSAPVPVEAMRSYVENSRLLLGDPEATAVLTLAAKFTVDGTADGGALQDTFRPTVDFDLTDDTLAVATDDGQPVTAGSRLLNPSESGELTSTVEVPATLPVPVLDLPVTPARWVSLLVLLVCLPALVRVGRRLLGPREGDEEVTRLLGLHGSQVVSVTALELRDGPVADVATFDDLLDLARRYNSLVMHVSDGEGDSFWLWDTGLSYRFRLAHGEAASSSSPDDQEGESTSDRRHGPSGLSAVRDRDVPTATRRTAR